MALRIEDGFNSAYFRHSDRSGGETVIGVRIVGVYKLNVFVQHAFDAKSTRSKNGGGIRL